MNKNGTQFRVHGSLSVVWATRNEELNIGRSIESVKSFADEMIVVDEYSTDKTVEIAKKLGAKVVSEPHHDIFHITKQKALDLATGEWILQMDADEVITPELARDIKNVLAGQTPFFSKRLDNMFKRHQKLIEERDGKIGTDTESIVAYFIPRLNMFLGRPLIHAGVYPDPAIRLIKKGKAHFPARSVHEIMQIEGRVGWLYNNMLHYDSPNLKRYLTRLNRYTDLQADELAKAQVPKNLIYLVNYLLIKSIFTFVNLFFRHQGYKDGAVGFLWSFFSASHFPIAYFKYYVSRNKMS